MRIGILTGGGDVPGLNPCIKAVVYRAIDKGAEIIGIRRGWGGLLNYDFARKLAQLVLKKGLPEGTLLNVNVPAVPEKEIKGVRVTRQGRAVWNDTFDIRRDPTNKEYYWLTGDLQDDDEGPEFDQSCIRDNYVSVTPLHYDLTDYKLLDMMERWSVDSLH